MERRLLTPRKYSMDKRKAAAEQTRQRILEATLALHSEKGIFGTSWQDIARRADVSVNTVYKHFPSLDELVPACGELMYAITRPPSLEDARTDLRRGQLARGAPWAPGRGALRLLRTGCTLHRNGFPGAPAARGPRVGGLHAGHDSWARARGPATHRTRRGHGADGERSLGLLHLQVLRGPGRPEGAGREGHQRGHPVLDRVLAA